MKQLVQKFKPLMVAIIYACIYFPWFLYLENRTVEQPYIVHMVLDDYIPFNEIFIIPYLLWFIYVSGAVIYFLIKDVEQYYKLCMFLFTGMTLFLIISTVCPNIHHLRPTYFERNNICTALVGIVYKADTPTNLFPSIHVFNSIGVHIAVIHNKQYFSKAVQKGSLILCISIILATVFLKQHSVFDVLLAFVCVVVIYPFVYKFKTSSEESVVNKAS